MEARALDFVFKSERGVVFDEFLGVSPCAVLLRPTQAVEGEATGEWKRSVAWVIVGAVRNAVHEAVTIESYEATPDG